MSDIAYTLGTNSNASGRNTPLVVGIDQYNGVETGGGQFHTQNKRRNVHRTASCHTRPQRPRGGVMMVEDGKKSPCLRSQMKHHEPMVMCVRERCGCEGGGKGLLIQNDVSGTVATTNDQFICLAVNDKAETLDASYYRGQGAGSERERESSFACFAIGNGVIDPETNGTLQAKPSGGSSLNLNNVVLHPEDIVLRRLTPTEHARLQGMPDWYCDDIHYKEVTEEDLTFWRDVFETYRLATNPERKPYTDKQIIKWLQDPYSDSAEYKMWGNGMALPCVLYVMEGVVSALKERFSE